MSPDVTSSPPDVDLIDRYFAGEVSSAEAERVREWAASRADRAALIEALRRYAHESVSLERPADLERGLRLLQDARHEPVVHSLAAASVSSSNDLNERAVLQARRWWSWRMVAGALGGVAVAALLLVSEVRMLGSTTHSAAGSVTTYATRNGERAEITLPGGVVARLNVASRLQVPADFASGHRTVTLQGEALFIVAHRVGAPLTVVAGRTAAHVLGTSFLVRRYPTDSVTTVAVRDGKVAVGAGGPIIVVTAMQQATLSRTVPVHIQPAEQDQFSFATGVLSLDGVPLAQAIPELDRWYDADIRLGDSAVAHHVLAATFAAGSLADLSEVLTLTLDVRVVRNGRVLTLYSK